MKFTDKFTFTTVFIVLTCIGLVVGGGMMSFVSQVRLNHQNKMDSVIEVVERQLSKHVDRNELDVWLPDLLKVSGVLQLQILRKDKLLFKDYLPDSKDAHEDDLKIYEYRLKDYPDDLIRLKTRKPSKDIDFTLLPLFPILFAVLLSFLLLFFSLRWIKKQFKGAELLEQRAKYLLQGNPTARIALKGEWPKSASNALDLLSSELVKSKRERGSFDAHIRSQVFLDKTTGLFNGLAFENRLDIILKDENIVSSALLIIHFSELDFMRSENIDKTHQNMLLQISELLTAFSIGYNDQFHARISRSEFAIIIPQVDYQETQNAAKKLTNILFQLQLPDTFIITDFFEVGVSYFQSGEIQSVIVEDAYTALTVASHQKESSWFLADQEIKQQSLIKGTVRWRGLLEDVIEKNRIDLFYQDVIEFETSQKVYSELFLRIPDFDGKMISASVFFPMAKKCGLKKLFDQKMLEKVLVLLKERGKNSSPISINISASVLGDCKLQKWLVFELMQLSQALRSHLIFEVSEHYMETNKLSKYTCLQKNVIALKKLGCKIAVDNVGKTVVNTEYITDLSVDYLKLHASLIHDIHLRKINQVAIQSLRASCLNRDTKLIAVGIESEDELRVLKKLDVYGGQGFLFGEQVKLSQL